MGSDRHEKQRAQLLPSLLGAAALVLGLTAWSYASENARLRAQLASTAASAAENELVYAEGLLRTAAASGWNDGTRNVWDLHEVWWSRVLARWWRRD